MSLTSQTNTQYVTSIQTPTDTVSNAIGLNDIDQIRANVCNVQRMVNFDEKKIFTNIIGKYDTIPIQVVDPINISNTFYVGGTNFTGGSGSGGGSAIGNGGNGINIYSNNSTSGFLIQFMMNHSSIGGFDGSGSFFYDAGFFGNSIFDISGTLQTNNFQLLPPLGVNVSSMYLRATHSTGQTKWSFVDNLQLSTLRERIVFSGNQGWQQGFQFETLAHTSLGFIDANGIWTVGPPDYVANTDLKGSNNVLVANNIRFKRTTAPIGSFVGLANVYGDLDYFPPFSTSFYVANQITCNGETTVLAQSTSISFAINAEEVMRINNQGFLGLGNSLPQATLDNNNATILRSTVQLPSLHPIYPASTGYILTSIDSQGTAVWKELSSITSAGGDGLVVNTAGYPVSIVVSNWPIFNAVTPSNLMASGSNSNLTVDISGVIIAKEYRGYNGIQFTRYTDGGRIATLTESGKLGIGVANPTYNLQVAGNAKVGGEIVTASYITAGQDIYTDTGFVGDGYRITNIAPLNIGVGSNNLSFFYTDSRLKMQSYSTAITVNFSTLSSYIISVNQSATSNITSTNTQAYVDLSTQIFAINSSLSTVGGWSFSSLTSSLSSVSNSLSTVTAFNYIQLSTTTDSVFSTIFTTASTLTSSFFGYDTQNRVFLSSLISTVGATGFANTSTSVGALSTSLTSSINTLSTSLGYIVANALVWTKRNSTISYVGDGVGIGKGNTAPIVVLDVSGSSWFHGGRTNLSTLGVGYAPSYKITGSADINGLVYSDGYGAYRSSLRFMWQSTEIGRFQSDARLMIGMSTPTQFGTGLDISGNINFIGDLYQDSRRIDLGAQWTRINSTLVYTAGRVGIGTTAPQNALDVAGTIRCRALQIVSFIDPGPGGAGGATTLETSAFFVESTTRNAFYADRGNVGIGISVPTSRLHVIGDILATSTVFSHASKTSTLTVSSINSLPAYSAKVAWSDTLLTEAISGAELMACSANITTMTSSYILATAHQNIINVTGSGQNAYTYIMMDTISSMSTLTLVPGGGTGATSLSHRVFVGPGIHAVSAWSYTDGANGSLKTIRADISATGHMF